MSSQETRTLDLEIVNLSGGLFDHAHISAPPSPRVWPVHVLAARRAAWTVLLATVVTSLCGVAAAEQLSLPQESAKAPAPAEWITPFAASTFEAPRWAGYAMSDAVAPSSLSTKTPSSAPEAHAPKVQARAATLAETPTQVGASVKADRGEIEAALREAKKTPTLLDLVAAAPEFDRAAASVAIAAAARGAGRCVDGEVSGAPVPVRVTFATSGRVTQTSVSGGQFVGTSAGSCIAAALRRAHVGAFSGDQPVVVSVTVHVR